MVENAAACARSSPSEVPAIVTATAQTCAAYRAIHNELPESDRVITDPLAATLAGAQVETMQQMLATQHPRAMVNGATFFAVRARYFDDAVAAVMTRAAASPLQLVHLGAGMDTRTWRVQSLSACHVAYEVDQACVLDEKRLLLERAPEAPRPLCPVVRVGAGLGVAGDWDAALLAAGFDPRARSVWVLEGLLYYLDDAETRALLERVRALCACGSCVLLSHVRSRVPKGRVVIGVADMFRSDMPDPGAVAYEAGLRLGDVSSFAEACVRYGVPQDRQVVAPASSKDGGKERTIASEIYVTCWA